MMKEYMNHLEDSMFKTPVSKACMAAALLFAVSVTAQTPAAKAVSTEKATPAEDTELQKTYRAAAAKYALEFDITELSADQMKAKADQLARNAAKAYQSGAYQQAVELYRQARAVLQKLPGDAEIQRKIENCGQAISSCYYYWAEKLYFDAQSSADAKQYEQAIEHCKKAAEVWPASKKRMDEMIARFTKLRDAAEYQAKVAPDAVDPGNAARLYNIDVLLKQGEIFYKDKQWDKARDKYEEVIAIDPYNITAIDAIRRVNLKLFEAARSRKELTEEEYKTEAEWALVTPLPTRVAFSGKGSTADEPIKKDAKKNAIYDKLKNIIIDRIDFDEIEIPVVLRHLRQRAKELDPDKEGVNIFLLPESAADPNAATARNTESGRPGPAGPPPNRGPGRNNAPADDAEDEGDESSGRKISVTADSISLGEAISYICRTANLRVKVERYAVIIAPPGVPLEQMETRIYPVEKDVVDRHLTKAVEGEGADSSSTIINPQSLFPQVTFDDGAQIVYDPGISRLFVTNTADNLQLIEEALKELNVVDPQVLIQTKFVEVHMNDLEELGFQYLFSRQNSNVEYMDKNKLIEYKPGDKLPDYAINIYQPNSSGSSETSPAANWYRYSSTFINGKTPASDLPSSFYYTKAPIQSSSVSFKPNSQVVRSLRQSSTTGALIQDQAFNFAHYNKYGYKVQATINALDQADSSDMLACPRITTMNGFEAVIAMVTERYFPDEWSEAEVGTLATGNGTVPLLTPSIPEFDEAERLGIELRVRPVVDTTDNYTISMTMTPSIRTFIDWVDYSYEMSTESNGQPYYYQNVQKMPVIEVRSVNTAVQCYDGETIVLGGIIKDTTTAIDDKYPILGTLPLVGRLFQSKSKSAQKVNLLIFLTCRLINPDGSPIREREMRGLPPFRY